MSATSVTRSGRIIRKPRCLCESPGKHSFKNGNTYEKSICDKLQSMKYKDNLLQVQHTGGSTANADITVITEKGIIKFETKNKGAFEGGCVKLTPCSTGLTIEKDCIQKHILGDTVLYGGEILPWYLGKRTVNDWRESKHLFEKDIFVKAPHDAISTYYREKGVHYIQIERMGLYHTGYDILEFGVPMFACVSSLRIRSSKHKKGGIPTDITAALQFERKSLQKSKYSLDPGGELPAIIQEQAAK